MIKLLMFAIAALPCIATLYNVEELAQSVYQFDLSYDDINISTSCSEALRKLYMLELSHSPLMLRYWDSWGKPSHGILEGHTSYLGYYDECINLKDTEFGETDYCVYAMQMSISISPILIPIQVGVCFPSSCSSQEFARILSEMDITAILLVGSLGNNVSVSVNSYDKSAAFCPLTNEGYDVSSILILVVCATMIVMVIVGTTVDIFSWVLSTDFFKSHKVFSKFNGSVQADDKDSNQVDEKHPLLAQQEQRYDRPTIKDCILAFSLYNTVPVLVSMKQSPSAIKTLSGIRFHVITLIVMGHVACYGLLIIPHQNPQYIKELLSKFLLQPAFNASVLVHSFFLLSALLSSYLTFKDMEKHGRFRYLYFYLHRYFRISPLLYFYTIAVINLIDHISEGPSWGLPFCICCKDNWWYNLVYLGNINDFHKICLGHAWYLFVDMQLFVLSPIIILLLYHYWHIGLLVIVLTMVGATTGIGIQAGVNDYHITYNMDNNMDIVSDLYEKPHYSINTYLIGIVLGYIFYKKYWITNLSINKWLKLLIYIVLWIVAIVLCTFTMFVTYKSEEFSKFQNVTYLMFNGLAWSTGLSIIIYICNTGYGGVVNSYLSWSVWEPLARMTYGVYLSHIIIITIVFGTFQSSLILTDYIYAILCVFTVVTSFAWSSVVFVFLELPISKVVSLCFKLIGTENRHK